VTFISRLCVVRSEDGRTIDSIRTAGLTPATHTKNLAWRIRASRESAIPSIYLRGGLAPRRRNRARLDKGFKSFQRTGLSLSGKQGRGFGFPKRLVGQYYALHRPNGATLSPSRKCGWPISPDLSHWGQQSILGGSEAWDIGRVAPAPRPFALPKAGSKVYHGNSRRAEEAGIGTYSAGVSCSTSKNPRRILSASGRLFAPRNGLRVPRLCPHGFFPTGVVEQDERLLVYYARPIPCTSKRSAISVRARIWLIMQTVEPRPWAFRFWSDFQQGIPGRAVQ